MSRVAFPLVLQSPVTGSALVGAKATIAKHVVGGALGSGEAAEIFEEETGAKKVAGNVITTDSTGRWTQGSGAAFAQYWLAEGRYDIIISGAGLTAVTITRELVTTELGLTFAGRSGSFTAVPGQLVICTGGGTVTLAGSVNEIFGFVNVQGGTEVTLKTAAGEFYGGTLGASFSTKLKLPVYQLVIVTFDGTNYLITGGEPKREQARIAGTATVATMEGAGITPSLVRPALTTIWGIVAVGKVGRQTYTIGGGTVGFAHSPEVEGEGAAIPVTIPTQPGEVIKATSLSNVESFGYSILTQ